MKNILEGFQYIKGIPLMTDYNDNIYIYNRGVLIKNIVLCGYSKIPIYQFEVFGKPCTTFWFNGSGTTKGFYTWDSSENMYQAGSHYWEIGQPHWISRLDSGSSSGDVHIGYITINQDLSVTIFGNQSIAVRGIDSQISFNSSSFSAEGSSIEGSTLYLSIDTPK